jgi:hypothetical protein
VAAEDLNIVWRGRAETADELLLIASVNDAHFDWEEITFDSERSRVTIPFLQEPNQLDADLPEPSQVGTTRLGFPIFDLPYYRCLLVVEEATRLEVGERGRDNSGMLDDVEYEGGEVVVRTLWGPDVRIAVRRLSVETLVSDSIAHVGKLRKGPFGSEGTSW